MKCKSLLIILLMIVFTFSGCSSSVGAAASNPAPNTTAPATPVISTNPEEELKQCDWTIRVNDTKTGTYKLPIGNKGIEFEMVVDLIAWKSGGADVYGKYEGEAWITFKVDESKMSDQDILMTGGALFDRRCEKMEFEIIPYDSEEFIKHIPALPGKTRIAPLGNYNGMSIFLCNWTTVLHENQKAIDQKTGNTLLDSKSDSNDGESVPMGISMLIEGASVTADIPTYNALWGVGYFMGTITGDPTRSGKREGLKAPDRGKEDTEQASDAGTYNAENAKIPTMPSEEDGKIDIHFGVDGSVGIDTDGDGVPDQIYESECSDGTGN